MTDSAHQQPYLHDLLACVRAPALVLTGADGQLRGGSVQGAYLADRRILARSVLSIGGAEPAPIRGELDGADASRSVSVVRGLGDQGADPTVTVDRRWVATGTGAAESITVRSAAREAVRTRLRLELGCDLAGMADVKAGLATADLRPAAHPASLHWTGPDGARVTATATPPPDEVTEQPAGLGWDIELGTGDSVTIELSYTVTGAAPPVVAAPTGPSRLAVPAVSAADPRLAGFLARSVADLAALELADPQAPEDHFLAAGAPWYLTLFGRDCLIAARMLLPLGTGLAGGTLRTLARRQGSRVDPDSAEEPGKILHEIRAAETEHNEGHQLGRPLRLPATYYGTVDATPLWILLLHDSWRWGLPEPEVLELLPNLERALAWLAEFGTDEDGFLSYVDESGHGLSNQGWKDSADSVSFSDGRLADPPVALSEVQAYGHAAAVAGAELLAAFGRPGADRWRSWAAELAERFRQRFWLSDEQGGYPALALDGHGRPVDSLASNMGHLLSTGLLSAEEESRVAGRLGSAELCSGFGLRTLAGSAARFNPLSYHNGSVWAHDTAIAISGLAATGRAGPATALIDGLLAAAAGFDYRMPELHGGHRVEPGRGPLPYPASCRPQAWSAAAAMAIVSALLGPRPDAPAGSLAFRPLLGPDGRPVLGELSVTGLRFAGRPLSVRVAADGTVTSSV